MILIGIIITVVAYVIARKIALITKVSLLNPILVASAILIAIIHFSPLTYETYEIGGSLIAKILGPVVVVLAVPLYNNKEVLNKYRKPVIVGVLAGIISSFVSVVVLAKLFDLDNDIMM